MLRSSNPTLNDKAFRRFGTAAEPADAMTLQGTVNKTLILMGILLVAAFPMWTNVHEAAASGGGMGTIIPWAFGGSIAGLILALVIWFKPKTAPITAPLYAVAKGLFLGAISAIFELAYPGIVIQAVACTMGTLVALLLAYTSRLIQATENFKLGVTAATGGIMIVYAISFVMRMFGSGIPYIHESGLIGIGFSVFVIIIAALNLVLDFDFIENAAEQRAPKFMEWLGAFGLLVTLVWLYIEFLRLLSKLRER